MSYYYKLYIYYIHYISYRYEESQSGFAQSKHYVSHWVSINHSDNADANVGDGVEPLSTIPIHHEGTDIPNHWAQLEQDLRQFGHVVPIADQAPLTEEWE